MQWRCSLESVFAAQAAVRARQAWSIGRGPALPAALIVRRQCRDDRMGRAPVLAHSDARYDAACRCQVAYRRRLTSVSQAK